MTLERARVFLDNSIPELENYILSETLYWQISADSVPLTIGNLYFEQRVLSAYDEHESRDVGENVTRLRARWQVNWQKKAEREYNNRLKLWNNFLKSASEDGEIPAAYYKASVRHRVILTLLNVDVPAQMENLLCAADATLRAKKRSSGFVWDAELAKVFPQNEFWYLY